MKSKDIFLKIFNSLSESILLIDRNYTVLDINRAGIFNLKQPSDSILGHLCFEVTHNFKKPCWELDEIECPVKTAFENNRRSRAIHKHLVGDQLIIEEVVATPIDEGSGEINYVVEEFRNITELLDLRENILFACASCNRIRDKDGNWHKLAVYIRNHTGADISHSFCPECFRRLYPESAEEMENPEA